MSRPGGCASNGRVLRDQDQAAEEGMRSALRSGVAPGGKPPAASAPWGSPTRVARLTATRGAGRGLPRRNRCFREPDGQAPALAQRDVIGGPIRHSVLLLRDVMTAIERHGGCPGSGTGPWYTVQSCRLTTDPCNKVSEP